jgi:colanic acid/amylovoran biosynthesis protein
VTPAGLYESDIAACRAALESLPPDARQRVAVCPILEDPREVKWVISKMGWFCGTRMHATIAALSSGVPAAAIAYSIKTAGVFETCGLADRVVDPRALDTEQALGRLWNAWATRDAAHAILQDHLPSVIHQAREQIEQTADFLLRDPVGCPRR